MTPRRWFYFGMGASAAFLLLPNLTLKACACGAFLGINLIRKRKVAFLPMGITVLGILAFNLVPPLGREWGNLWGFPLTEGALKVGLDRALTFEGLLLASRAAVGPGLQLPGRLGWYLAETYRCFGMILGLKGRITWRNAIPAIDALLEALTEPAPANPLHGDDGGQGAP